MEHAAPAFGFSSLQRGSTFPRNSSFYHTSLHTTNICVILCCLYIGMYFTLSIYHGVITSCGLFLLISCPSSLQLQIYTSSHYKKRSIFIQVIQVKPRNYIPLNMWTIYKLWYLQGLHKFKEADLGVFCIKTTILKLLFLTVWNLHQL